MSHFMLSWKRNRKYLRIGILVILDIYLVISRVIAFQNNPKNLDLSNKTDLDFLDYFDDTKIIQVYTKIIQDYTKIT